jgi:hypothetical protein
MQQAGAGLPAAVQQYIRQKSEYQGKALTILTYPIWSTVIFAASVAGATPVVATMAAGQRSAFQYGLNGDMAAAGAAGVQATPADTNLQIGGQTRDQADVFIYGLAAYITQDSEPGFVPELIRNTDVSISTNGSTTIPLGTLDMFPAPGGAFGMGRSKLLMPKIDTTGGSNADGGPGAPHPFFSNGNPTSGSFYRLDAPILWSGVGSGPDSSLSLACNLRKAIVKQSGPATGARAAAAGIGAFTPITAADAFVAVRWRLFAASVQLRSVNS